MRLRSENFTLVLILAVFCSNLLGQDTTSFYANTPKELLPYRRFQKPYKLFFSEPQPFLGSGREKLPLRGLQEVKIGFLGPLENAPDGEQGVKMLRGATLAIEEANEQGGYRGIPYRLVVRNDTGLWGASSNEFVRLEQENVWAVLGSIGGASTHVALRAALKLELPFVNTGGTDPTLTETAIPWFIRCIADDRQNSYALAFYIYKIKGFNRVAVLRNNNRYGRTGIIEFKDAARRLGRPLLFELRYATGDTSFTEQLDRIRSSSAQAVVIWENSAEIAGRIVKQMRALGMQHAVFGADRLVSPEFVRVAGQAAEGVVATYPYDPTRDDSYLQSFKRRYYRRFNEEPEAFAAHAYDGMNILIQAIRTTGLNRVRIRDVLTSLKSYNGVTGKIIFDPSHNDVGPVWLAEVRQGEFHYFLSPLSEIGQNNSTHISY